MNKKVTRIFITLCLMLVMTSSTVFAATSENAGASTTVSSNNLVNRYKVYTRTIRYKILSKNDSIVRYAEGREVSAYITGDIEVTYDKITKKYTVNAKELTFTGENASKYYYEVKYFGDSTIHVVIQTKDKDLGYLYYHADTVGFHTHCINYSGH